MGGSAQTSLVMAGGEWDLRAVLEFIPLLILPLQPGSLTDQFGVPLGLHSLMQGVHLPAGEADVIDASVVPEGVAPVAAFEVHKVITDAPPLRLLPLLPERHNAVAQSCILLPFLMGMQDLSPLVDVLFELLPDADEAELPEELLLVGEFRDIGVGRVLDIDVGGECVDPRALVHLGELLSGEFPGEFGKAVYHFLLVEQLGIRTGLLPGLMRDGAVSGGLITVPGTYLRPLLRPVPVGLQLPHSHKVKAAHLLQLILIHLLGGD
jgi:hypothetical protein